MSQEDIANVLQRSSAAMRAAGNTLEETIALGVGGQEIVRNAEMVGTAIRTVSIFYSGGFTWQHVSKNLLNL